jgi:hypothetical protein
MQLGQRQQNTNQNGLYRILKLRWKRPLEKGTEPWFLAKTTGEFHFGRYLFDHYVEPLPRSTPTYMLSWNR